MQQFTYNIQRQPGVHARPACLLAMLIREYDKTRITVARDGKTASGELLDLMNLDAKPGTTVTVTADGPDEEAAIRSLKAFFQNHF